MNEQIKGYTKEIIWRGITWLGLGCVFLWLQTRWFEHGSLVSIVFLLVGLSTLLAGLYFRRKYKGGTTPPSPEAIDLMIKFPSGIWKFITAIMLLSLLVLDHFFPMWNLVNIFWIIYIIIYLPGFFSSVRKLDRQLSASS